MGEKSNKNSNNYIFPIHGSLPRIGGVMLNIVRGNGLSNLSLFRENKQTKKSFMK